MIKIGKEHFCNENLIDWVDILDKDNLMIWVNGGNFGKALSGQEAKDMLDYLNAVSHPLHEKIENFRHNINLNLIFLAPKDTLEIIRYLRMGQNELLSLNTKTFLNTMAMIIEETME